MCGPTGRSSAPGYTEVLNRETGTAHLDDAGSWRGSQRPHPTGPGSGAMVVLGKRISDRVGGLGSRRVNRRGQELFPIKTHFNLSPAQYEALRTGHMYRRRRELVEETLRVRGDEVGSVLEVGSGTGALLAELASRFPAMQFLGVDVDPRMISHAQERHQLPNLRFALSDITSDGSRRRCEFVYSIDVIHHIHQPLYFFRAVRQMLRRGGVWLVMEPNIFHPYILWQQERMHRAGFDEDHFRPWLLEPLM